MKFIGDVMGEVKRFKYLRSVLPKNGDFEEDMEERKRLWQ